MKLNFLLYVGMFSLASLGLSACQPSLAPLYAPTTTAGIHSSGASYTANEIKAAVLSGLQAKNWHLVTTKEGRIEAETTSGRHTARVVVSYNASGWSIGYISSSPGLKYQHDPQHGTIIHRRYNHWIRMLNEAIGHALVSSATPGQDPTPEAPAPPPSTS